MLTLAVPSSEAKAAPSRQACLAAYEDAQLSMRRGRLLHSREPLGTCLEQSCPPSLRTDCADWLKEVESRMPTVVIECVADGVSVRDVKLFVDGVARPQGIDGLAIELDPGNHAFRVEPKDSPPIALDALVREGEKLKPIRIELPSRKPANANANANSGGAGAKVPGPTEAAPLHERSRPVPWSVYASAGVGVLALGGFSIFAISGASAKSDLEPCKPDCSESQISDVHGKFITADIFLGVSLLALGTATVLYLTRPTVSVSSSSSASASSASATTTTATWNGVGPFKVRF